MARKRHAKPNAFLSHPRPPARGKLLSVRAEEIKGEEDLPPFIIRGQTADSKPEYWVSLALDIIEGKTGWGWAYQVPVNYGRLREGGNVIDFLVYTPGRWTMLDPMGRPFHTGAREDRFQMERVARQKNWNLLAWFTDEPQVATKELTLAFLMNKLHV